MEFSVRPASFTLGIFSMKTIRLFAILACTLAVAGAAASGPPYTVELKAGRTFDVVTGPGLGSRLSFFARSMSATRPNNAPAGRNTVSNGYQYNIRIRSKEPATAVQEIFAQISQQTGLMFTRYLDGGLPAAIAPAVLMQGYSETSVFNLFLLPKANDEYLLVCSYVIDERPAGSIDGTPEAVVRMEEAMRYMTADSIATVLPASFTLISLKQTDYFRGLQSYTLTDPTGTKTTPVAVLLLKKGPDYTVGFYTEAKGTWSLLDQPAALDGMNPPHLMGRSVGNRPVNSIHAVKQDDSGGIDLFIEDGQVIPRPF
jgi:hypothetical protein